MTTKLRESDQKIKNWGGGFTEAAGKMAAAAIEVGVRLDQMNESIEEITRKVTTDFAMQLDVDQPINAIAQVRRNIDLIPDVTYKQLIMLTQFSASPPRPFSEFLPFMTTTFSQLASMIQSSTPDVVLNVPNIRDRLAQIESLERQAGESLTQAQFPLRSIDLNAWYTRQTNYAAAQSFSQQAQNLRADLAADIYRAQRQAAGGSAGGGGGVTVNLDLRESVLSREFLDNELIPALERAIIRTTGQDPQIRVTS